MPKAEAGSQPWSPVCCILTAGLAGLAALTACGLLHAAVCAFSWQNFHFLDYGGYTNMLWNTAHARPFLVLVDRSYLEAHLSFTLALLAPLYRAWDHPLLLVAVQWLLIVGGTAWVVRTALQHGLSRLTVAVTAVFMLGYPFAQGTMLSEFHGTSLLFLLLPWLYDRLTRQPASAWLPLLLLLGVREDSFLVVLPILVLFAFKQRSLLVWLFAAGALVYGVTAIFFIYPAINGMSLLDFRANWLPTLAGGDGIGWTIGARERLPALAWTLLPLLPALWRDWKTALAFVALPLGIAMLSTSSYQHALRVHYATPVLVCIVLALLAD